MKSRVKSWTTTGRNFTSAHKQSRHKHERDLEPAIISQLTTADNSSPEHSRDARYANEHK